MGISQSTGVKSHAGEAKIVNHLFVGIDVGSKNNAVYQMKPVSEKHGSFQMQNNLSGAVLNAFMALYQSQISKAKRLRQLEARPQSNSLLRQTPKRPRHLPHPLVALHSQAGSFQRIFCGPDPQESAYQ